MSETTVEEEAIGKTLTVKFKRGLRTDGELISMTIEQFDSESELTQQQAVSLARVIRERIGE